MKRFLSVFFSFFVFTLLLNCHSVHRKNDYVQRQWMLVSFNQFKKAELIKNRAEVNLTSEIKDRKINGSAFMGCNRIFFEMEFKNNNRIEISGIRSTYMSCEAMDLETKFLQSFQKMSHYHMDGHFLILNDKQGNTIKFLAADWD
ncbi:META domain-containing protein [Chryseobacterium sp.]|uniref:META domain-containing protein n=1 Tax=Chryseobacterium sp. TaxID=1871047 RepID=UPI00289FEE0B|nr:META domain-containing protein [Chryseobacterium sp.]